MCGRATRTDKGFWYEYTVQQRYKDMFMKPPKFSEALQPQYDLIQGWSDMITMWSEAQTVITLRMLGMAGLWSVAKSENQRMLAEKLPAITEAMIAASLAGLQGQTPGQIAQATLRPIRRRTRQNFRRLTRRGPRIPGH